MGPLWLLPGGLCVCVCASEPLSLHMYVHVCVCFIDLRGGGMWSNRRRREDGFIWVSRGVLQTGKSNGRRMFWEEKKKIEWLIKERQKLKAGLTVGWEGVKTKQSEEINKNNNVRTNKLILSWFYGQTGFQFPLDMISTSVFTGRRWLTRNYRHFDFFQRSRLVSEVHFIQFHTSDHMITWSYTSFDRGKHAVIDWWITAY